MAVDLRDVVTVLLPGTGSDDDYVRRAFGAPLRAAGATVIAPAPQPERLLEGYRQALGEAARDIAGRGGRMAVGGVSIGAAVAVEWALAHPDRVVAVLAALPAWSGSPDTAPAAAAARYSAHRLREDGLAGATAQMRATSPAWLAEELSRSWAAQWPALPEAMEAAAGYVAPTTAELARLTVPLAAVAAEDDPVHPIEVARAWVAAAPRAALRTVTLAEMGADPSVLGARCVAALQGVADARTATAVEGAER